MGKPIFNLMKTRKGAIDVDNVVTYMIGILVVVILLFTWFFPTLNGSTGINNSTTLWLGGTNYNWFVPVMSILLLVAFVLVIWKAKG